MAALNIPYAKIAQVVVQIINAAGSVIVVGDAATARNVMGVRDKIVAHQFENSNIRIGDVIYFILPNTSDTNVPVLPKDGERFTSGLDSLIIIDVQPVWQQGVLMVNQIFGRIG